MTFKHLAVWTFFFSTQNYFPQNFATHFPALFQLKMKANQTNLDG